MKWLDTLELTPEQKQVITENVEKMETNHNATIETMEKEHKVQLQNTREATEKRVSKKMVSMEDFEEVKAKLNTFETKELDKHLDTQLNDLPIKDGFVQDVKDKVASTIDYEGVKDTPEERAKHFIKTTQAFLDNEENARFKATGEPALKPAPSNEDNPASADDKKAQAEEEYNKAFDGAITTST